MKTTEAKQGIFLDFFYLLREVGLPVSVREWLTLMEACDRGLVGANLTRFYSIARSILVKSEKHYDLFDQCFAHFFADAKAPDALSDALMSWLENPIDSPLFSEEELAMLESLGLEELKQLFEERMKEQNERHDGGNRWIGTGGTSPFGHGGNHPSGIRVGGQGRGSKAVQIAANRRFRDYRRDVTLDTRQLGVALRRLRQLGRQGLRSELDIDQTISATARNAGDLAIEFRPPRENRLHVVLMMDVGGSMDPFARLVSQLFSAAHQATHFKSFESYYFHNCIYERIFPDARLYDGTLTRDFITQASKETRLVIVGDAHMAPYELVAKYGAIDYYQNNDTPGIEWLKMLRRNFDKIAWFNPIPKRYWSHPTIRLISDTIPMYELTLEGIDEAVQALQ